MKKFFFDCGTRETTASLGIFVLRVLIGLMMFFGHGLGKLRHFATIKDKFPVADFFPFSHMSRQVSLGACIIGEVVAALCIIFGFATRPAAFVLGMTMVVAAFQIHGGAPWILESGVQAAKEPALLYLIPMIALIFSGAGAFSLDAGLYREKKSRRW
jgi:putative oxidoreductase